MIDRVLFIDPIYVDSYYHGGRNIAPSMGIGYVAEMLELNGIECETVDLALGYPVEHALKRIGTFKPQLVAISLMTLRYKYHYRLIERIKKYSPIDIKIIVGGPHVTSWKTKVLEQCSAIDLGVSLEGEYTVQELCQGKDPASIPGLIYRDGGRAIFNGERQLLDDLESISFPRYRHFELDKYEKIMHFCSSRGCPYRCTFCQFRNTLGKKWRHRSAESVVDEMEYWYKRDYRRFSFIDDNFTLDKKRVYRICDEINKRQIQDIWISAAGVRADRVDRELLERMRSVGFENLSFGVEAGNNRTLKMLKKHETIEQIDRTIKDATELGFQVKLYFLVGSPYETLDDIRASIDFALKYPIAAANFSNIIPMPETELLEWIEKNGRLLADPADYLNDTNEFDKIPLFDAPGMSIEERKQALAMTAEASEQILERARSYS
ncbi:MAG: B12-binding domain-containing radical SAM protein [Candidatus Brocadiales bacterium]